MPIIEALGYAYGHVLTVANLGQLSLKEGDYSAAQSLFCEALRLAQDLGSRRGVAWFIASLGMVAAARGDMPRAARLMAADVTLRAAFDGPPMPYYRQDQEHATAAVRGALDERMFETFWSEGAAMSAEEALAYALEPAG
jgi:hypothetical protein